MVVFSYIAEAFARSTNSTDFQSVTAESCLTILSTIYSTKYRVCTVNTVAYVLIALICLAIVGLMGAFLKYFHEHYFYHPEKTMRELSH